MRNLVVMVGSAGGVAVPKELPGLFPGHDLPVWGGQSGDTPGVFPSSSQDFEGVRRMQL